MFAWRVQRRYRWLWFEFWKTVMDGPIADVFYSEQDARDHVRKLERMDAKEFAVYFDERRGAR